jgi:hypothetical protein
MYVIDYRKVKKNVEYFGLKEWFEGILLFCESESEVTIDNIESVKVIQNLGKIQSPNNNVRVKNRQGMVQTSNNRYSCSLLL